MKENKLHGWDDEKVYFWNGKEDRCVTDDEELNSKLVELCEEHYKGIICSFCKKSCRKECKLGAGTTYSDFEYAEVSAVWGYLSNNKDGEIHKAYLCEECYDKLFEQHKDKITITSC